MRTRRARSTTRLRLFALGALIALASVSLWSQAREDEKAGTVLLADGTPIHLVLMDDLQGKELRLKQTVHFKVREDLVVGLMLIVKTGAGAIGHIESVSKSGLLGKSGSMQCDKSDYRGVLAGLEGISGKKAVDSDALTVKN